MEVLFTKMINLQTAIAFSQSDLGGLFDVLQFYFKDKGGVGRNGTLTLISIPVTHKYFILVAKQRKCITMLRHSWDKRNVTNGVLGHGSALQGYSGLGTILTNLKMK